MLRYMRQPTANLFLMTRTQVRIWNTLSEGPLDANEICKRLCGTADYFEIMDALHDMAHRGDVSPLTGD